MFKRFILDRVILGLTLAMFAVFLAACGSRAAASSNAGAANNAASAGAVTAADSGANLAPYSGSEKILVPDASAKSVTINLVAAETNASDGFNFNGYARGAMVIKVPTGWKVTVNLRVDSAVAHSALIVPYGERFSSLLHPAFSGAQSPDYRAGITKGQPAQQFTFSASKPGTYAIVCGVPGHDNLGMWDGFEVIDGLSSPQLLVKG